MPDSPPPAPNQPTNEAPPSPHRGTPVGRFIRFALLGIALLALMSLLRPSAGGGQTELDAAIEQAEQQKKPLLLAFGASWCEPCHRMRDEVLPQPDVAAALEAFIYVPLDHDAVPDAVARYNVQAVPSYLVVAPSGEVVARISGYHEPERFAGFLRAAAQSTNNDEQ